MLHLHRSERADALVGPLARLLASPPDDPFAPEVVAVPTRGVERWLAQRLSHVLGAGADGEAGVCAHVAFPSPAALVADVLTAVLGVEAADDPWRPDRLVWPLLDVLDDCAGEAWCSALGRHLGADVPDDDVRAGRRLAVARHVAGLLTSYGSQRPSLLRAWAAGVDGDGAGRDVPADLAWQAELLRRVRDRLAVPTPAERLQEAVTRLREDPALTGLPARLSVVGPTRLPEDQRQVLLALAAAREVHLWLLHPSPALWDVTAAGTGLRRRGMPSPARHPLLASTARDATELAAGLRAVADSSTHHPAPAPPATLLGLLQRQLRADAPPQAPPARLELGDRSVQVHACHGRARQVEVLREVLVGLVAADPSLEPRDILVMAPDVEAVAPLVAATFGTAPEDLAEPHPGQRLRVRLADRSLRQTNPLLALLSRLLLMADGRVTASEVLDVAAAPPVRRRFSLGKDDVDRLRTWAVAAGVRWGEDRARRARFGLEEVGQGTWQAGLDRLLLGAAMEEDGRWLGPVLPLDDVDSTDVDLLGRVAELLDRLRAVLASLDAVQPLAAWLDALDGALDLLADVPPSEDWQRAQARQVLADVRLASGAGGTGAAPGGGGPMLRLPDVRALLADRLQGRPTRAGFRTGALTVCSLVPMRSVPHRVVVLLGMDDGAFPRSAATDGDDVLLRDPLVGERDRRSEDRQLFLDAVTAAAETLVVLYGGAHERTGAPRPPAVPVGELLDALDRTATTVDGRPAREQVVVRHPLQPFDERAFVTGALGAEGPFSFDRTALGAAEAARGRGPGRQPFLPRPLPPVPKAEEEVVELDALVRFAEHPVAAFLRQRLGVALAGDETDVSDRLPLHLDPLDAWAVGDRVLSARLAGAEPAAVLQVEWRRGEVPPRALGRAVLEEVGARVEPLVDAVSPWRRVPPSAVDAVADLPDGRAVNGTVLDLHDAVLVRAVYSRLGAKHRLRAWVQLVLLAAARPDVPWTAVTVGRGQGRSAVARVSRLRAPSGAVAGRLLDDLVDLRDRGLREPLPLPCATAARYAASRSSGDTVEQALDAAGREWADGFEPEDPSHVAVWGERAVLADLVGEPGAGEAARWPEEGSRFGALARRLWQPLLEHEEVGTA